MDDIETAAADTTSECSSSSPNHFLSPPLPSLPSSTSSHITPTPQHTSLFHSSSLHTQTDSQQTQLQFRMDSESMNSNNDSCDEPLSSKRLRIDSGSTQETGLLPYISRNKPIGIAQPFQKEMHENEFCKSDALSRTEDLKSEQKFHETIILDSVKSGLEASLSTTGEVKPRKLPHLNELSTIESDSGTDTTSSFDFQFELTSMDLPESNMLSGDDGSIRGDLVARKELVGSLPLPSGKKCHVFVTHSTSDQQWAQDCIITPLSPRWRVKASYHFMPDPSRYDNERIKDSMENSCVVLIGLSPSYIRSQRCTKEWQLAVKLSDDNSKFTVLVGAVNSPCNRPPLLKPFEYLDFIREEKKEIVWNVLVQNIRDTVQRMLPPSELKLDNRSGLLHPHIDYPDSDCLDSDCHSQTSQSTSDFDAIRNQEEETGCIMAGFEAMWAEQQGSYAENTEEAGLIQDEADSEAEGLEPRSEEGIKEGIEEADKPQSTHLAVLSDGQSQDISQDTTNIQTSGIKVDQGSRGDVEEGELSDSSEEVPESNDNIASFYNNLARPDADKRNESPIKLMRNFNNWVKSILIRTHLNNCPRGCTALDICCGKGGDLLKWKEGKIQHLVCADISSESIIAAQERYHSDKMKGGNRQPPYTAEFYITDCTKDRLIDLANSRTFFHIASCQFSLHYSFESYEKAHMMLRNACESLRPGGYFIGTTIDANQLVYRLRQNGPTKDGSWSIGNEIFTVTLDPSLDIENLPLFGARYNFRLHGVVDLPEYLVYFPLLAKMLESFQMELVLHQNFFDFFDEHRYNTDDCQLMYRMEAFSKAKGTMSQDQWEAVGLYLVYVFRKKQLSDL